MSFTALQPFGPKLAKFELDSEFITKVNEFIDSPQNEGKMQPHGSYLAGEIKSERLIDFNALNESTNCAAVLSQCVGEYVLKAAQKKITKMSIASLWVNDIVTGDYNPVHWHDSHISGVFYSKLSSGLSVANDSSIKKNNKDGAISFIHGSRQFLSDSLMVQVPSVGDLFLFPSYLMHQVNPFKADGIRRSIAFNCNIDEDIFNCYK